MFFHLALIIAGVVLAAWGLTAAHRLDRPFDILAAACVPAGVSAALLGTLLLMVPGFFRG